MYGQIVDFNKFKEEIILENNKVLIKLKNNNIIVQDEKIINNNNQKTKFNTNYDINYEIKLLNDKNDKTNINMDINNIEDLEKYLTNELMS